MNLGDLKITLKSILTSTQKQLSPRDLNNDFKELEGFDFPFRKFGFPDFLSCLKSAEMADTVKVQFDGAYPVLLPVLSEKSKHIEDLVLKQKSNRSRARTSVRRPVPASRRPRNLPPRLSNYGTARSNPRPYSSSASFKPSSYQSNSYQSNSYQSNSYQSNSYQSNSYQSSSYQPSQYANSANSSQSYSNSNSNRSYSAYSQPNQHSNGPQQPSVSSFKSDSKPPPLVPTYMKEKVINFMKTRPQGVTEEELGSNLMDKSFRDYGFSSVQIILTSFSDILVKEGKYVYLSQEQISSHVDKSNKYNSPIPAGYEDEAFTEEDGVYSDEDVDYAFELSDAALSSKGAASQQQLNGSDPDQNDRKTSQPYCKSRCSTGSFESDSGCFDAANEKMGTRLRQNFQMLLDNYPDGISLIELGNAYKEIFEHPFSYQELGFSSMIEFVANHPSLFFCLRIGKNNDFLIFDTKKEIPDKYKVQSKDNKERNPNIPIDIYENMKQLLVSKKTTGLLSSDVEKLYEKKYGQTLRFSDFGFDGVNTFLVALSDLCYLRPVKQKVRAYPRIFNTSSDQSHVSEPDPFLIPATMKPLIPQECCDCYCKIPIQQITDEHTLKSDDGSKLYLEVTIAEVYSPTKFWLHLRTLLPELSEMMDDLDRFYKEDERNYSMPPLTISIGQICAAKYSFDGRWHRVRITSIPNINEVTVYYLDYGTVAKLPKNELRFLHRDFEEMPAQAIRGTLYNLKPVEGNRWSQDANELFYLLTEDRALMAEITQVKKKEGELELVLVLYDTNGDEDVVINDVLLDKGFAKEKEPPSAKIPQIVNSEIRDAFNALSVEHGKGPIQTFPPLNSYQSAASSPKMAFESIHPPPGFQKISSPEPTPTLALENGLKNMEIAQSWSPENFKGQSFLGHGDNIEHSNNAYNTTLETVKKTLREEFSIVCKEELKNIIMDSLSACNVIKPESAAGLRSPSICSETSYQDQSSSMMNCASLDQSFSQTVFPGSSLQNPLLSNSQSSIPNVHQQFNNDQLRFSTNQLPYPNNQSQISSNMQQLSNISTNNQYSFHPLMNAQTNSTQQHQNNIHQYLNPQDSFVLRNQLSSNVPQASYQPSNFQNPYSQDRASYPIAPPGLVNPSFSNQYLLPSNTPHPNISMPCGPNSPFVPFNQVPILTQSPTRPFSNSPAPNQHFLNSQAPVQSFVNPQPFLNAQIPNQPYLLPQMSNQYYPEHFVPKQMNQSVDVSNRTYQNIPQQGMKFADNFVSPYSTDSSSSPLIPPGFQNVQRDPPGSAPVSAYMPATPGNSQSVPFTSSASINIASQSSENYSALASSLPESCNPSENSTQASKLDLESGGQLDDKKIQPSSTVISASPASAEVETIMRKEAILQMFLESFQKELGKKSSSSNNESPETAKNSSATESSSPSKAMCNVDSSANHTIESKDTPAKIIYSSEIWPPASSDKVSDHGKSNDDESSSKSAFEEFCKQIYPQTMSEVNSNLLSQFFPQLQGVSTQEKTENIIEPPSEINFFNNLNDRQQRLLNSDQSSTKTTWTEIGLNLNAPTPSDKPELEDKFSTILSSLQSSLQKEDHRTSEARILEKLVVCDKVLHLLKIDSAHYVITDEFISHFTTFTKRQTMEKILSVRCVVLPFDEFSTKKLPQNLSQETLSILKKFEKFEKINVLPVKYVHRLLEEVNADTSLIQAFKAGKRAVFEYSS